MKGYYRVAVRSLRTGLKFWTLVEADDRDRAKQKAWRIIRTKKGSWWPTPDQCGFDTVYHGTTRPKLNQWGDPVEVTPGQPVALGAVVDGAETGGASPDAAG